MVLYSLLVIHSLQRVGNAHFIQFFHHVDILLQRCFILFNSALESPRLEPTKNLVLNGRIFQYKKKNPQNFHWTAIANYSLVLFLLDGKEYVQERCENGIIFAIVIIIIKAPYIYTHVPYATNPRLNGQEFQIYCSSRRSIIMHIYIYSVCLLGVQEKKNVASNFSYYYMYKLICMKFLHLKYTKSG